jgi:hypothetical protein
MVRVARLHTVEYIAVAQLEACSTFLDRLIAPFARVIAEVDGVRVAQGHDTRN